jgi:hypothetical protein
MNFLKSYYCCTVKNQLCWCGHTQEDTQECENTLKSEEKILVSEEKILVSEERHS